MRNPSGRYDSVRKAVTDKAPPADPLAAALYNHLTTKNPDRSDVGDAYDIFREEEQRAVLEAFLLAEAPASTIDRVLGIAPGVVDAYKHLFFDLGVFRNRLELLAYATEYEGSSHAREIMRASVTIGLEYLLWVYGRAEIHVDTREVIRRTMAEAYYRGMAHRGNSITSGVSKEAHRWWATAVRNAELLEKIDPRVDKQAFEEIRIQLEKHDDTYTADEAPVDPSEIMH